MMDEDKDQDEITNTTKMLGTIRWMDGEREGGEGNRWMDEWIA